MTPAIMRYNGDMTKQPIPEPKRIPPDHVGVLLSAGIMFLVGWGGLFLLMTTRPPRLGAELWLFFFLGLIAVTGTVLPFVRYIHMRLTPAHVEPLPGGIIVRQSVWIGLYGVIVAWMQVLRVLTPASAFFLATLFIIIEAFLRSREREDN